MTSTLLNRIGDVSSEGVHSTLAGFLASTLSADIDTIITLGYTTVGDRGALVLTRVTPAPVPVEPWHILHPDGSYWLMSLTEVGPEHFGAVIDDLATDNYQKIADALDYAATFDVPFSLGAGSYRSDSIIQWPSGVSPICVPGKSIIDFSFRTTWEWTQYDVSGLIRCDGALGTDVSLTQDADPFDLAGISVLNTTVRSGTTVTMDTARNHGFATGDHVWIDGASGSTADDQFVFFSMQKVDYFGDPYGHRTDPISITVTSPTQFTFTVADSGATTLSVSARVSRASNVLKVSATASFADGQLVLLKSDATASSYATKLAELLTIERVVDSTTIITREAVRYQYNVSDNAKLAPVTPFENVVFNGLTIKGKGPNTSAGGPTEGDVGFKFYLARNVKVINCRPLNVDHVGIMFFSCYNFEADGNVGGFSAIDQAGLSTGDLDIQYFIAMYNACRHGLINGNYCTGGRHAIVISTTGFQPGCCIDVTTSRNHISGTWSTGIAQQGPVNGNHILGNMIDNCDYAIDIRDGFATVRDNRIKNCNQGIAVSYNGTTETAIDDNQIDVFEFGINISSITSIGSNFFIRNNRIRGGQRGIFFFTSGAYFLPHLEITGNDITETRYQGIYCLIGDATNAAHGFSGLVSNNVGSAIGLESALPFIIIQNANTVDCSGNRLDRTLGTATTVVTATGAATANCDFTQIKRRGGGGALISAVGAGHEFGPSQSDLAVARVSRFSPAGGGTTVTTDGAGGTVVTGTATSRGFLSAEIPRSQRRLGYVSAAGAGSSAGLITHNVATFLRGSTDNVGGFRASFIFFHSDAAAVADARFFVGMYSSAAVIGNVNPSTLLDIVGIGCDNGGANVLIMHNDGAGACTTIDLGANFPANTFNTDIYHLTVYAGQNSSSLEYKLVRLNTGHVASGRLTANIPTATTFLAPHFWRNNGATALAVGIDVVYGQVETYLPLYA